MFVGFPDELVRYTIKPNQGCQRSSASSSRDQGVELGVWIGIVALLVGFSRMSWDFNEKQWDFVEFKCD